MDIKGIGGKNSSYPIDRKSDSGRPEKTAAAPERDRVELSAEARRIASLVEAANRLPEVRKERVAELSRAIRQGVHRVEPEALARSILEFEDALP